MDAVRIQEPGIANPAHICKAENCEGLAYYVCGGDTRQMLTAEAILYGYEMQRTSLRAI